MTPEQEQEREAPSAIYNRGYRDGRDEAAEEQEKAVRIAWRLMHEPFGEFLTPDEAVGAVRNRLQYGEPARSTD